MLFDLRGRGRRRTVQVIYLGLAILMGGGLIFFGIGGAGNGGLLDAFKNDTGSSSDQIEKRVTSAKKQTTARPQDPRAWAVLANAEYQLAGASKGYDANTGEFSGTARKHLVSAKAAWDRHLGLAGDKPDDDLAATMRNALTALGDAGGAVRAQEIVLDGLANPGFGDYAQLAALAYAAKQDRKGDLAANKAKELAPKDQKKDLEQSLAAAKAQAAQQGAAEATPTATQPAG